MSQYRLGLTVMAHGLVLAGVLLLTAGCAADNDDADPTECVHDAEVDADPVETGCRAYHNCSVNCRAADVQCHDSCWTACTGAMDEETCFECRHDWLVWPPLPGLGADACNLGRDESSDCYDRVDGQAVNRAIGDACEVGAKQGRCRVAFDCCDDPTSAINDCLVCELLQGSDDLEAQSVRYR